MSAVLTSTPNTATERQLDFIATLAEERDWDAIDAFGLAQGNEDLLSQRFKTQMERGGIDKAQASAIIEWLMKQPRKRTQQEKAEQAQLPEVPNGHYALLDDEGLTHFFRIRTPDKGNWKGFTFVDAQGGGNYYPIRDTPRKTEVLAEVAKDPQEALLRYGKELGICGHCHRELTDETSRELGIGPVCRKNLGW